MVKKNMDDTEERYQSALDYLYTFIDFSLTRQDRLAAANFDLKRMFALMELLGNPQNRYPVIHVAGTKGKGSTAAMIASILQAAGLKVGLYTSPHLQDYCERIQVDRQNISHATLVELIGHLKPAIAKVEGLTSFEITTALGFQAFADARIEIAVVEVGLGGRLDATNVVDPLVSVITSLSYDHMNVLGNTLSQIATEKAGIIKPNRPIVLAPQEEIPRQVIEKIAGERSAPLIRVGRDFLYRPLSHDLDGQNLVLWTKEDQPSMDRYIEQGNSSAWKPLQIYLPLLGYHQVQNAATAYAAIEEARKQGIRISPDAVLQGFKNVKWPGRFELMSKDPILVLDSAHNPDSALKLRLALDDYLNEMPIVLVFGVSEDKDIVGMFDQLMPRIKVVVATQSTHPRAFAANKLVELAHQFGRPAIATSDISEALECAIKLARGDAAIVVAGSIFVAAAVREEWPGLRMRINEIRGT
jgi:dihydrofolate synthase/folylpolyglutamate synthase